MPRPGLAGSSGTVRVAQSKPLPQSSQLREPRPWPAGAAAVPASAPGCEGGAGRGRRGAGTATVQRRVRLAAAVAAGRARAAGPAPPGRRHGTGDATRPDGRHAGSAQADPRVRLACDKQPSEPIAEAAFQRCRPPQSRATRLRRQRVVHPGALPGLRQGPARASRRSGGTSSPTTTRAAATAPSRRSAAPPLPAAPSGCPPAAPSGSPGRRRLRPGSRAPRPPRAPAPAGRSAAAHRRARRRGRRADPAQGRRRARRRQHGGLARGPDRDLGPRRPGQAARGQPHRHQQPPAPRRGGKVSFTHLIGYALVKAVADCR